MRNKDADPISTRQVLNSVAYWSGWNTASHLHPMYQDSSETSRPSESLTRSSNLLDPQLADSFSTAYPYSARSIECFGRFLITRSILNRPSPSSQSWIHDHDTLLSCSEHSSGQPCSVTSARRCWIFLIIPSSLI